MKPLRHITRPLPGLTTAEREALYRLLNGEEGTSNQRGGIRRIIKNLVQPESKDIPMAVIFKKIEIAAIPARTCVESEALNQLQALFK